MRSTLPHLAIVVFFGSACATAADVGGAPDQSFGGAGGVAADASAGAAGAGATGATAAGGGAGAPGGSAGSGAAGVSGAGGESTDGASGAAASAGSGGSTPDADVDTSTSGGASGSSGSSGAAGLAGSAGTGSAGMAAAAGGGGSPADGSAGTGCDAGGPIEVCNGTDDDGDGLVDEPSLQNTAACNGCTPMQRNGFAYWFCTTNRDWAPSRDNCIAKGAHLASIHDQAENDFVTSTMLSLAGPGRVWFGLNDRSTEGGYAWLDGTPVDFTFFNCSTTANPSAGSEDCANFIASSKCWDDDDCSGHSFPSVCRAPHPICP